MATQEDLGISVGAFTLGEMISDLREEDFPARVAIPACFVFDAATREDLIEHLASLWEGWDADTAQGLDGIAYDRLYLGWGYARAYAEDAVTLPLDNP